jgi:5,5'-dehydrodivanillate O-demethylase
VRSDSDETSEMWTIGRVFLWPLGFYLGEHFEWRVPVDDENTLSIGWFFARVPSDRSPYVQTHVPHWEAPLRHPDGRWISSHVMNQDIIAWVGQGVIADRTKENLGASDRGIAMIRNRFLDELEKVAAGAEPKGLIRDREAAKKVALPVAERRSFLTGRPLKDYYTHPYYRRRLADFPWHAGQPAHVREAFCDAMGVDLKGQPLVREPAQ